MLGVAGSNPSYQRLPRQGRTRHHMRMAVATVQVDVTQAWVHIVDVAFLVANLRDKQ